jgi:hypothetical protein
MCPVARLAKVLKNKSTVVTRAVFWKIQHATPRDDIRLKVGRYVKDNTWLGDETPESGTPRSELTLDDEEFKALVSFISDSYEPFRQGVKAFIPLTEPFALDNAIEIKKLFALPDKHQLVRFILSNDLIPEDLAAGLEHAHRARAVKQFEAMLHEDRPEKDWQAWFEKNCWVLGSEFVGVLDERAIDVEHISDFLMRAYDGFVDIVEIKRPEGGLSFWAGSLDHGNPVPSAGLTKAISQASRYIFELEREANSVKFMQRVGGVKTVKPRCTLIFWTVTGLDRARTRGVPHLERQLSQSPSHDVRSCVGASGTPHRTL